MGGGVPALVVIAQPVGIQAFLAQQAVDQRGLSHAGGADEGHRAPLPDIGQHLRDPVLRQRRGDQHVHADGDPGGFRQPRRQIVAQIRLGQHDWRAYLPASYYITHFLGPLMRATGATPRRVTAFAIHAPNRVGAYNGDNSAIVVTQNDDGSVFRVVPCGNFGANGNSYRICGEDGQVENIRGMEDKIMLRCNGWSMPQGMQEVNLYDAVVPDEDDAVRPQTGHGGSDFLTVRMFLRCIQNGTQPEFPFNVHAAVAMSSVAILSHRSVLEGGAPYDVPDLHDEAQRRRYEDDRLSPFPGPDGSAPTLPCCSVPSYRPSAEEMAEYEALLRHE